MVDAGAVAAAGGVVEARAEAVERHPGKRVRERVLCVMDGACGLV